MSKREIRSYPPRFGTKGGPPLVQLREKRNKCDTTQLEEEESQGDEHSISDKSPFPCNDCMFVNAKFDLEYLLNSKNHIIETECSRLCQYDPDCRKTFIKALVNSILTHKESINEEMFLQNLEQIAPHLSPL